MEKVSTSTNKKTGNAITVEEYDGYKVNTIDSCEPGPYIVLLGGVHGDEPSGVINLEKLATYFHDQPLLKGKISLILANTKAVAQKKRYVIGDLNRLFGNTLEENTGEYKIGKELANNYLSKSDLVIDIHDTSPTKNFTPFMFADDLSVNHVIPSEIRFCIKRSSKELLAAKNKNQSSKGTASEWFMQSIGKQGICVEVGTLDKDNSDLAYNITKNILQFYQMIEGKYIDYNKDKKDIYYWDQFYTYDPENFEFAEGTYEGKELQSGEVIGYIEKYGQQKEVKATQPCKILFMLDKNNYDQIRKVPSHIQKFSGYALINKIE